ncbi:GNAT family N-acetyltransferase [Microbulbifer variabilis]|uniref:GNAT family N-acetyltransferase n=1 Tax=Microbulbifer variabilis TaxID=266805 RepID=UPI001CFE9763|nr:GNAT family N-acetyltransferase [Microbulbifer variabilis]
MLKQSLLTGGTLEDNPPANWLKKQIKITQDGGYHFYASVPGHSHVYGTLDLYLDYRGDLWINHIDVQQAARRCGVGSKLVLAAIKKYGKVYASRSGQDAEVDDDDTRHLSHEGAALVNHLIARGAMKETWLRYVS